MRCSFIRQSLRIAIVIGWKMCATGVFSRQLWWGHQIPVFYSGNGISDMVVGKSAELVIAEARERSGNPNLAISDLKQDEDVLDTWFLSSWFWPISVFDGD